MTEFKKLDEYLNEYLEASDYNIVKALSKALKIGLRQAKNLYKSLDLNQEIRLVNILDNESLSDDDRSLQVRKIFDDEDLWEDDDFSGVDLAEDYNYRCSLDEKNCRDKYMDWLEENNYDFLIDNAGKFAVKCSTRESMYKARRMSERCRDKEWLRTDYGMNVDPVKKQVSLDPADHKVALRDHVGYDNDVWDSFKGSPYRASPFSKDTTPSRPFPLGKEKDLNDVDEGHEADKRKAAKRKERAFKTGGPNPAKELSNPQYRKQVVPDKKTFNKKKERQAAINHLDEDVVGFGGMQSLGRMRTLAGMSSTNEDETTNDSEEMVEYTETSSSTTETEGLLDSLQDIINRLDDWFKKAQGHSKW